MWLVSTSWKRPRETPAPVRVERLTRAVGEFVTVLQPKEIWYQPRQGHTPDDDQDPRWADLIEESGDRCRITVRTRRLEPSAEVTFVDCDRRTGWAGSMHARIVVPEGDVHPSLWGEVLENVATACETHEVVALKVLDLVGWEPDLDGFAPGRHTYLTRHSTRHPRMERLGLKVLPLQRGELYSAPGRDDQEVLQRIQLWAHL